VAEPATSRTQRNLGLDERFALQKLCTNEADRACYTRALAALDLVPEPQLDDLRDDEQHALARACFVIQNTGGPAAWRQCMTEQAARLRSSPDVNLDALVLTERNAALNSCNNSPVTDYRNCLNRAGAPAANRPAIATRGAPSNAPATGVLASLQTRTRARTRAIVRSTIQHTRTRSCRSGGQYRRDDGESQCSRGARFPRHNLTRHIGRRAKVCALGLNRSTARRELSPDVLDV